MYDRRLLIHNSLGILRREVLNIHIYRILSLNLISKSSSYLTVSCRSSTTAFEIATSDTVVINFFAVKAEKQGQRRITTKSV